MSNVKFIMKKKVRHTRQIKPVAKPLTSLEQKQQVLNHLPENLLDGSGTGIMIAGSAGTGKSRCVKQVLKNKDIDPVLINSHCTPKSLYETLRDNADAVIWLDDCEAILSNLAGVGILRSALFADGPRMVTYLSTTGDGPQQFEFKGKVIICSNTIPKGGPFAAVVSRIDTYSLNATREELVTLMRALADQGFESLTPNQCHEVIDFIDQGTGGRDLSMRFYKPSLQKRIFAESRGIDWKILVESQLQSLEVGNKISPTQIHKADDKEAMKQALKLFSKSAEQQDFWMKQTRRSRASFFRVKKEVQSQIGNQCQFQEHDDER